MRGGFAKVPFLEAFFWHCNQAVNTTTNNYILYLLLFIYISPLFTVHYSQLVKFHFFDEDITNCELYAANWWIVCESSPIFQGFSIWVSVWLLPCVSFGVEDHRTLTEPSPTPLCWCEAGSSWGRDLVSTGDSWIEGSKVSHRPVTEGDLQLRQELVHALQAKRAWNLSSFYWFMLGFPIHCVLEIVRIESHLTSDDCMSAEKHWLMTINGLNGTTTTSGVARWISNWKICCLTFIVASSGDFKPTQKRMNSWFNLHVCGGLPKVLHHESSYPGRSTVTPASNKDIGADAMQWMPGLGTEDEHIAPWGIPPWLTLAASWKLRLTRAV